MNESEFWMNILHEWTDFRSANWIKTPFTELVDEVLNLNDTSLWINKAGHHILNKDFGHAQIVYNEPVKL